MNLDSFLTHYTAAALWTTNDNSDPSGGDPLDYNYDRDDIAPDAFKEMKDDCRRFIHLAGALLIGIDVEQSGHDFWLTRNGHGAGFWDRG